MRCGHSRPHAIDAAAEALDVSRAIEEIGKQTVAGRRARSKFRHRQAVGKAAISLAIPERAALNSTFCPSPSAQTICRLSFAGINRLLKIGKRRLIQNPAVFSVRRGVYGAIVPWVPSRKIFKRLAAGSDESVKDQIISYD